METLSQSLIQFHVDDPTIYPRATLFKISGWVISSKEITSVTVGSKVMQLTARPDVDEVHKDWNYRTGFEGLARESELDEGAAIVTAHLMDESIQSKHLLGQDELLSLSKSEKLSKFSNVFSEDPNACIANSVEVEVENQTDTKKESLHKILRCQVCNSVGVRLIDNTPVCDNNHQFECIDRAFMFLTGELRTQHNIQSNSNVASRAQDPLAVALIGKLKDGLILDCGAGLPFQNYRNVINYEIEKFENTDVIGVGEELPFADNSFDGVFSFSVLEHVKDPYKCASEISRVLKPNGILYCSVPFLIPVHGYPHHYYNMTSQGLDNLFSDKIDIKASGVPSSGHPFYTLNSVAGIWHEYLPDEYKEEFRNLTIGEILDSPSKLVGREICQKLPEEIQKIIACTTMVLGTKKISLPK